MKPTETGARQRPALISAIGRISSISRGSRAMHAAALAFALGATMSLLPVKPAQAASATVQSFSPQGEVQRIRQVRARFS
ncbi:hypothetical protein, partial [Herbaspirillum seropedicae]|uniref:hypothetical protein n=1 Tax=Herbaspirillum seropedicae TaxID=964 RepID=UPI0031D8D038